VSSHVEKLVSRQERFEEFCRRLQGAPRARTFAGAYEQVCSILNVVEDELTAHSLQSGQLADGWAHVSAST
jgi:hypothetical protein